MLKVIIHNDDLGLTYGFSQAIYDCFTNGITTSTSVRTNGTAYSDTITRILPKMRGIGLGLHVNLTDGPSYNKLLADTSGNYKRNFIGYLANVYTDKRLLQNIESDLKTQFMLAIEKDKLKIDHVNGHDHIHMIPPIFEIVAKLCDIYSIKYIRLVNEDYYFTHNLKKDLQPFINANILKFVVLKNFIPKNMSLISKYNLKTTNRFYGLIHTGSMDIKAIKGGLLNALDKKYSLVEILSHPVLTSSKDIKFTSDFIKNYVHKKQRLVEYQTLKGKDIKKFIKKKNIVLTNYARDLT